MPLTASEPKSFTPIAGKRILDWSLEAFRQNGLDRFVFIGGYLMDVVRRSYDAFEFVENANWPNGNILFSLLCARDHLGEGFYSTYTDTLFRPEAVGLLKPTFPILGVFRLKGQPKRDSGSIVRSCKASQSPAYPIRDAVAVVEHPSCPSSSSSCPLPVG